MKQEKYQLKIKNKKKRIAFVVLCLLLVASVLWNMFFRFNLEPVSENNKCWMKDISDEKTLSEIMIPGVHNAGTSNIPLSLFVRCQKLSINNLLLSGYRYLDIRAGVDNNAGDDRLVLYHNFIPCLCENSVVPRKLTFDEAMEDCYTFLKDNPSETIIVMLKYERGNLSVSEFEKLVAKSIEKNKDMWLLTDETPCLKDARGKIVLYRRYTDDASLGKESGIECVWEEQQNTDANQLKDLNLKGQKEEKLIVQDQYKLVTDDKWNVFLDVLEMDSLTHKKYPIINFLSTVGNKGIGIPYICSNTLNGRFAEYDMGEKVCPQWIIVDFGDESISEKIINANFK